MKIKHWIILGIVALFGCYVLMIFVPDVVKKQQHINELNEASRKIRESLVSTANPWDDGEATTAGENRCPNCGSWNTYGDGFVQLEISEHDLGGRHVQPYKPLPVLACIDCGVVRLDLQRINSQLTALESLEERL